MITTNYNEYIEGMAEHELDELAHSDCIEDYVWEEDYYLSNVIENEYLEDIKNYFEINSLSLAIIFREKIKKEILKRI